MNKIMKTESKVKQLSTLEMKKMLLSKNTQIKI